MAFGQIDPARLDGDALTRWYLRSTAHIEEEKRQRAAQAYKAFIGQSGGTPSDPQPANGAGDVADVDAGQPTRSQVGPNRWRGDSDVVQHTSGQAGYPDRNAKTLQSYVAQACRFLWMLDEKENALTLA